MADTFGNDFRWFGLDQADQKGRSGVGGVGILIRKSVGSVSLVKVYKQCQGLWIKLVREKDIYFICGVYIQPCGSKLVIEYDRILFLLEADILEYRKWGKVIIMGDFNARIGSFPSMLQGVNRQNVFSRVVTDIEIKGVEAFSRGKQLMRVMNGTNMVVMNGLDSGGDCTFHHPNSGSSMIDYIVLSDNIFSPHVADVSTVIPHLLEDMVEDVSTEKSGLVLYDYIPKDSLYCKKSCTVWKDDLFNLGDHSLVTCQILVAKQDSVPVDFVEVGEKLDIIKWDRRDIAYPDYWANMQTKLQSSLATWNVYADTQSRNIDLLIKSFNEAVNYALANSLRVRRTGPKNYNAISWDPNLYRLTYEENRAFCIFLHADSPSKEESKLTWKKCKLNVKNAIREKERKNIRNTLAKIEALRSSNPRDYWKGLYKLDYTQPLEAKIPLHIKNSANCIVGGNEASQVWLDSFSKLGLEKSDFGDFDVAFYEQINSQVRDFEEESRGSQFILDHPITLEEVQDAIKKLKKGKAVGVDGIFNEVFKCGDEQVATYLWKLFQLVFESEQFPEDWARGLIFPLFKGGPEEFKLDPNKYRGITLLSIVGKTYTVILNKRLSDWAEANDIFVDEQAGFRRARSTIDQLFILLETIKFRRPKTTYCAFIDVAKAYDKVWRNGLWYKLWKVGIKGKLWRVLKNIYRKVESSVLLGDNRTAWFLIEVGLRQGCILSPILFTLFINDLRDVIERMNKGVKIGTRRISILFFADDIVLLANNKQDLEYMLKVLYNYSVLWRFKYNYEKCGVVRFKYSNKPRPPITYGQCNGTCTCGSHYQFGPNLINEVLMYKYLGAEIDYKLSFKDFKMRILAKARANMGRIWQMGIRSGFLSVKASLNLYQALVRSILEFSSEIWGFDLWREGEQIQLDMAKRILRCSMMTSRPVLVGELGLMSLHGRRNYKKLMFWLHIVSLPNSRLLKHIYLASKVVIMKNTKNKKANWATQVKEIFEYYGLNDFWTDPTRAYNLDGKNNNGAQTIRQHKECWKRFVTKKIMEYEEKKWLALINDRTEYAKLRTYCLFKKKLRLENYLHTKGNYWGRSIFTSLRSGTNKLMIEKGRWIGLEEKDRLCVQCDGKVVESERHFLISCNKYNVYRLELFTKILHFSHGKWNMVNYSENDRFLLLINGTQDQYEMGIFGLVQNHLTRCYKIRNDLVVVDQLEDLIS